MSIHLADKLQILDKDLLAQIGKELVTVCRGRVPKNLPMFCDQAWSVLRPLVATLASYQTSNEILRLHMAGRWVGEGMPTFVPTQGLAASLVLTTYKKTLLSDVPFPFSAFCVQIPSGWLKPPFDCLSSIWVNIFDCHVSSDGRLVLAATPEDTVWASARPTTALRIDILSRKTSLVYHQVVDVSHDIEKWLANMPVQERSEDLDDVEHAILGLCMRLLVGLSLYIATIKLGPPNNAPVGKRKVAERDRAKVWVLGRDVKLPAPMRQAAGDFTQSHRKRTKGAGDAWKLSRRFVVRGHFKRVHVGPRSEAAYKISWIEPYWKGPENGLVLERVYSVTEAGVQFSSVKDLLQR